MSDNTLSIWRLEILAGRKYLGLIPDDLSYFKDRFVGEMMSNDWSPPSVEISGKSKRLPDFVIWMVQAPVLSERAVSALEPAIGNCVQFLRFHAIKGRPYKAMNVTTVRSDLLDGGRSDIWFSESGKAVSLRKLEFVNPVPVDLPPVFKISFNGKVFSDVYVTKPFADVVVAHQLTGVALADPKQSALRTLLDGKAMNVVPCVKKVPMPGVD